MEAAFVSKLAKLKKTMLLAGKRIPKESIMDLIL
jgi:hypothetical protein